MIGIDTNILVYAYSNQDPKKRKACSRIFHRIHTGKQQAIVPAQVLAEFSRVMLEKIEHRMDSEQVYHIVSSIITNTNWHVAPYTADDVASAALQPTPFWDALLEQALLRSGATKLLTENIDDFSRIKTQDPMR